MLLLLKLRVQATVRAGGCLYATAPGQVELDSSLFNSAYCAEAAFTGARTR